MASSRHRRNEVVHRSYKAFDNPHFFKVVHPRALKEQKLEIPKKFVREHGLKAFLNNRTCLKVADGKEWTVGLTKSNGKVWFHHGWQNFVEFYSIGLWYFLVFGYESRSSSFHVVIFDLTGTEVEYPIKKICLHKAKEKVKMEIDLDDLDLHIYPKGFKVGEASFDSIKPKLPSTSSQRERAMAKATTFQSMTLNPSFMCKIWPSHIQPGKSLNVPRSFAEIHLEEPTNIILQVSDGRMWEARYDYYQTQRKKTRAEFKKGWKKFAAHNNLEVGDACVFEMIRKSSTRIAFKVEIFRAY